ncbi:MAG: sulfite exporter TauE/SafE family protein [Alphaproteobacteria bacterium]|nr:sulfite exporter TauE/SafE family protein [Alphaproteobacteria bacterium]
MPEPATLVIILAVFLLAGFVKGVVGMGLPLVSVGLLTAIIGLQPAIALLVIPALLTNIWQGLSGPDTVRLFRRFWPLFLPTMFFTWPGTMALKHLDVSYLSALLGVLLIIYTLLSLMRITFNVPPNWERPLNPVIGAVSGVLAGLTGAFSVPGVVYLQSTRLSREELVQAMGMIFTLAAIGMSVSLSGQNLLPAQLGLVSAIAVIPAVIGMTIGTRIRMKTSEQSFRRIFLIALGVLGAYIVVTSTYSMSRSEQAAAGPMLVSPAAI